MRLIVTSIFCLILFFSCSKSNGPEQVPPPVNQDTLLSGWTKYNLNATSYIFDIAFSTLAKGYISVSHKGMYQSTDSGKTWKFIPSSSGKNILTIRFLNSQYGYCVGDQLYKTFGYTSNGGDTWNFNNSPDGGGNDIQFLSPSLGYVAGKNGLYKTIDMGTTWTLLKSGEYSAIHFLDEQKGWAASYDSTGRIYATTDGGITWNVILDNGIKAFYSIQFFNSNTGWATSPFKLLRTVDGGTTWQSVNNETFGNEIEFLNTTLGYKTEGPKISKSIDGGQTWTTEAVINGVSLYGLVFLDPDHGWATGDEGTILRYSK